MNARRALTAALALVAPGLPLAAQGTVPESQRIERLEQQNAELERRLDVLAGEFEGLRLSDVIQPVAESRYGLGPAASKVYSSEQGVTIGGYGELIYENLQGETGDEFDFTRAVLYFGYKFDEKWIFNSEIEVEHADEIFLEFAYLDYLNAPALNARAGLLLVPMGFLNELHEPTTFYSATRPRIEQVILPSTWRENGAGIFGELGDFAYRTYVVNGFDGTGFSADGLRGGRQKGSDALADDFAWTGRLDYVGTPGLLVGVSGYIGDSGQEMVDGGDVGTTILEGHAEYRWRGWRARGLYAMAEVDDVAELNAAKGVTGDDSVGEELEGWYVELGYDLMDWLRPASKQSLIPFARYETFDTQAEVPSGFLSDPSNDVEVVTLGVAWQPIDQVVFKLDYQDFDNDAGDATDLWHVSLGYIF